MKLQQWILLLAASSSVYAAAPYITSKMSLENLQQLASPDSDTNGAFGCAVAIDGDTAVVGACKDDSADSDTGAVYVYERNASNDRFVKVARLVDWSLPDTMDFGSGVAVEGDTVVVGMPDDTYGTTPGRVYIFEKPAGGWSDSVTYSAILSAHDGNTSDALGTSVAIDNNIVAAGAPNADKVYIYSKPAGGWHDMNESQSFSRPSGEKLGSSVAIDNGIVVAGAPNSSTSWQDREGVAYLVDISTSSVARLTYSARDTGNEGWEIGTSVSIDSDTIVVGAPLAYGTNGKILVYEKPGTGWEDMNESAVLGSAAPVFRKQLGSSVDIEGDRIVAGAKGDINDTGVITGSIYVFNKASGHWQDANETYRYISEAGGSIVNIGGGLTMSGSLGNSIAISRGTVIAGNRILSNEMGGASILKDALVANTPENSKTVLDIEAADADNDTISYQIIGGDDASKFTLDAASGLLQFKTAPDYEAPQDADGNNLYELLVRVQDNFSEFQNYRAFVRVTDIACEKRVSIKNAKLNETQELITDPPSPTTFFSGPIARYGNTIAVGNTYNNRVYVYELNPTSHAYELKAQLRPQSPQSGEEFGQSLDMGDGVIAVGAPHREGQYSNSYAGKVFLFVKPASGWTNMTETAQLDIAYNSDSYTYLGSAVTVVDPETVAAGASGKDNGRVYVYRKPPSGWQDANETFQLLPSGSEADYQGFGRSLSSDNGTIVVGSSKRVYLFEKPASGWAEMTETAQLRVTGTSKPLFSVSLAIENNTVIAGDPDQGQEAVYLYSKPSTGWQPYTNPTAKLTASVANYSDIFSSNQPNTFGNSVALSRDIVAVGAPGVDSDNNDTGAVFLFERPAGGWTDMNETTMVQASNSMEGDLFGRHVNLCGTELFSGAPWHDVGGNDAAGTVYRFNIQQQRPLVPIITYLLN